MSSLVGYQVMDQETLNLRNSTMYDYVLAKNGVFISAANPFMQVLIPLWITDKPSQKIRGLNKLTPYIRFRHAPRVPAEYLKKMVDLSRRALPNEILFHLAINSQYEWFLNTPPQINGPTFATPLEDNSYIPIEVHSHNTMAAFFSGTDNLDETGLRIYGVFGRVDNPVVDFKVRISVYGHYSVLPYQLIFEPINEVRNG